MIANRGGEKMKRPAFIILTAFLFWTVIFSGCRGSVGNGGSGGSGGGGGSGYYTLNVTVEPNEAGAVGLDPEPIEGIYEKNTKVTLKPIAEEGYEFSGWGGPNEDDVKAEFDKWIIIMDGNKQLVATFTEVKPEQVAAPTASPLGDIVAVGTEITLTTVTQGAAIYYTVDGTDPTEDANEYSADNKPQVPEGGMTLKAFAVKAIDNSEDLGLDIMRGHFFQ